MKTFKPGNHSEALSGRALPDTPGFDKVQLFKKNKPSKGRVKVTPNTIVNKKGELVIQSDVGGDGGDQYLFDMEELKKVMNEATGATDQQRNVN